MTEREENQPASTPFEIGEIWDIEMTRRPKRLKPHVEDVLVTKRRYVSVQEDLADHLLSRIEPWEGSPLDLFEGHVQRTGNDHLFIRRPGIPSRSTWFWLPDSALKLVGQYYTHKASGTEIKYVGEEDPAPRIPAGALVRVSLARWWKPDDADDSLEKRCYLQVSGWFS